jgi:hypothetical protein
MISPVVTPFAKRNVYGEKFQVNFAVELTKMIWEFSSTGNRSAPELRRRRMHDCLFVVQAVRPVLGEKQRSVEIDEFG